jgi:uncharacterized protein YfiM (DUF2279 family)
MTEASATVPPSAPAGRRRLWAWLLVAALLLVTPVLLFTSSAPRVLPAETPDARDAAVGRQVLTEVRGGAKTGDGWATVLLDDRDLAGLSGLAARASGIRRMQAGIDGGTAWGEASVPLPLDRWANVRAWTAGSPEGFPPIHARIGVVELPPVLVRPLLSIGPTVLRLGGISIPPPASMLRDVQVEGHVLKARVRLPRQTGVVGAFAAARTAPVSAAEVRDIYCWLAAEHHRRTDTALEEQVRRAFALRPQGDIVEANRAALIAIAMLAVSPRVGDLAGLPADAVADCPRPSLDLRLAGRRDLAKHWALSAALAAAFGQSLSRDLGEWKELSDSFAGGSGFSFVDIAANRSGIAWAERAIAPASAATTRGALTSISREALFPLELLAKEEGLSADDFERRYGNIDSPEYGAVVQRIDRHLARGRAG